MVWGITHPWVGGEKDILSSVNFIVAEYSNKVKQKAPSAGKKLFSGFPLTGL